MSARIDRDQCVAVFQRGNLLAPHMRARSQTVDQRNRRPRAFLDIVDGLAIGAQHWHELSTSLCMIFSENRFPLFGIMHQSQTSSEATSRPAMRPVMKHSEMLPPA